MKREGFALFMLFAIAAHAHAGVRVTEPAPPRPVLPVGFLRASNLQLGLGPALSPHGHGPSGSLAFERVFDSAFSVVVRSDFVRLERTERRTYGCGNCFEPTWYVVTQRATLGTLEVGGRLHGGNGPTLAYLEAALGIGVSWRNRGSSSAGLLNFGFGLVWQPIHAPIGAFAEIRTLSSLDAPPTLGAAPMRLGVIVQRRR